MIRGNEGNSRALSTMNDFVYCDTISIIPVYRTYNFAARQQERDVFDTLFDSAPDRVNNVKEVRLKFKALFDMSSRFGSEVTPITP